MSWVEGRWTLLLAAALALPACRAPTLDECRSAIRERRWEDGARTCGAVYGSTSDPRAGMNLLLSLFPLGRHEEALAVIPRLKGFAGEPTALMIEGRIHEHRGQSSDARRSFEAALEMARKRGDHRQAADAAGGIYRLAALGSQYRQAFEALQIVEKEARAISDRPRVHQTLLSLAQLLEQIGDRAGARRALAEAETAAERTSAGQRLRTDLRFAMLELAEGNLATAAARFEQVQREARALGVSDPALAARLGQAEVAVRRQDLPAAGQLLEAASPESASGDETGRLLRVQYHYLRGRVAHGQGDHTAGLQSFQKALDLGPAPDWAWLLRMWRGLSADALGRAAEAEADLRRAVDLAEGLRTSLGLDELRAWFFSGQRRPHAALFDLLVRHGRVDQALTVLERAQSRTFVDTFFAADQRADDHAEAALARADLLQRYLPTLRASPVAAPLPVNEVRRQLAEDHVIAFLEDDPRLWFISMSKGQVEVHRAALTTSELRSLLSRHRADPDDREASERLGQLFPRERLPPLGERLYIVPSEAMAGAAFPAFRRGGRFLIADHDLAQVPSITALALLARSRREGPASGQPLVLGDAQGDLESARREAMSVSATLGVPAHTGAEATSARLRAARDASLVHLAVHSGMGTRGAWLRLADGVRSQEDLLSWRLRSRLIVLSSCASAITRQPGLWGSLATTFLAGGTSSVVGSTRSIDDVRTAELVDDFYAAGGAREPLRALAETQRRWASAGRPVGTWASFAFFGVDVPAPASLAGDGRARRTKGRP